MAVKDSVAGNVRAELARQRVSQRALADRLGISQQAVSARPTGQMPLKVDELARIADLLGVTVASLIGEPVEAAL